MIRKPSVDQLYYPRNGHNLTVDGQLGRNNTINLSCTHLFHIVTNMLGHLIRLSIYLSVGCSTNTSCCLNHSRTH
ncbi:hypothetical protein T02_14718 [Trichinella nativa]|uniref:Uncharacterized protein n=1 Tax=Trichinella nativa TaxID=6335 RepID=A0A0V1LUI2_9BILA|nr:hypothetical protein T02_14718 [Trichinella nativa]